MTTVKCSSTEISVTSFPGTRIEGFPNLDRIKKEVSESLMAEDYSNVTVIEPLTMEEGDHHNMPILHDMNKQEMCSSNNSHVNQITCNEDVTSFSESPPVLQAEGSVSAAKRIFGYVWNQQHSLADSHNVNFMCNFCVQGFRSKSLFLSHLMTHIFTCNWCSFSALSRQELITHVCCDHTTRAASYESHLPLYLDQIKMVKRVLKNGTLEKMIVPLENKWDGEEESCISLNNHLSKTTSKISTSVCSPSANVCPVSSPPIPETDMSILSDKNCEEDNKEDQGVGSIRFNLGLAELEFTIIFSRLSDTSFKCPKCLFISSCLSSLFTHLDCHHHQLWKCDYCSFSTNREIDIGKHQHTFHVDKLTSISQHLVNNINGLITDQQKFVLFSCLDCCFARRSHQMVAHHICQMHTGSFMMMCKIHSMPSELAQYLATNEDSFEDNPPENILENGKTVQMTDEGPTSPPTKRRCGSDFYALRDQGVGASYQEVPDLEEEDEIPPQTLVSSGRPTLKSLQAGSPISSELPCHIPTDGISHIIPEQFQVTAQFGHNSQEPGETKLSPSPLVPDSKITKDGHKDELSEKVICGRYGDLELLVYFLKQMPPDLKIDLSQYFNITKQDCGSTCAQCRVCGQENHGKMAASRMREHCMRHADVKYWGCKYCTYKCNRPGAIIGHVERQHPKRKLVIVRRKPFDSTVFNHKIRTGGGSRYLIMYELHNMSSICKKVRQAYSWLCPFCGRRDLRRKLMMVHIRTCHPQHEFALEKLSKVPRFGSYGPQCSLEARNRFHNSCVTLIRIKDMKTYPKLRKFLGNHGSDSEMEWDEQKNHLDMGCTQHIDVSDVKMGTSNDIICDEQSNLHKKNPIKCRRRKRQKKGIFSGITRPRSRVTPSTLVNGSYHMRSFLCTHCHLRFRNNMLVKQHILNRHHKKELTALFIGKSKNKYYFMCPYISCKYASSQQQRLSKHIEKNPDHFSHVLKNTVPDDVLDSDDAERKLNETDRSSETPLEVQKSDRTVERDGEDQFPVDIDSFDTEPHDEPGRDQAHVKNICDIRQTEIQVAAPDELQETATIAIRMKTRLVDVPLKSADVDNVLLQCRSCDFNSKNSTKMKTHLLNEHTQLEPIAVNIHQKALRKAARVHFCPVPTCNYNSYYSRVLAVHVNKMHPEISLASPQTQQNIKSTPPKLKFHGTKYSRFSRSLVIPEYRCAYCHTYKAREPNQVRTHQLNCHFERPLTVIDMKAKVNKQRARIFYCENPNCDFGSRELRDLNSHECSADAPESHSLLYSVLAETNYTKIDPIVVEESHDLGIDDTDEVGRGSTDHNSGMAHTYQCSFCNWITGDLSSIRLHCQVEHNSLQDGYTEMATGLGQDGQVVMRINSSSNAISDTSFSILDTCSIDGAGDTEHCMPSDIELNHNPPKSSC